MNDYKAKIEAILASCGLIELDGKWVSTMPRWETHGGGVAGTNPLQAILQLITEAKIEELEAIADKVPETSDYEGVGYGQGQVFEVINSRIAELKGEDK